MTSRLAAGLLSLFLAIVILPGCKQGEGEICQVDSDCEDGLKCSSNSNRCVVDVGSGDTPDAGTDGNASDGMATDAMAMDGMAMDGMAMDGMAMDGMAMDGMTIKTP